MRLGSRDPVGKDALSDPELAIPKTTGILIGNVAAQAYPSSLAVPSPEPAPSARKTQVIENRDPEPVFVCLALIETASIAVGFVVADALVKRAPVRLLRAQSASPGKFFVLYGGDVASVQEAHTAGLEAASQTLIDELLLPNVHGSVLPAIEGLTPVSTLESFAVIETFSFAAAIVCADVALKEAPIHLIEIRPPIGLGGKSFVTLSGDLGDLDSAVNSALEAIRPRAMLCRHALIANPHPDLLRFVF